jgi:hypothetical protein
MMAVLKFLKSRGGMFLLAIVAAVAIYNVYMFSGSLSGNTSVLRSQPEPFSPGDIKSSPAEIEAPAPPSSMASAPTTRHDTVQPADLLPPDSNAQWNMDNNLTSLSGMKMPSVTSATFLSGIDTIGQSMKNPNLQLRSDPVIPRVNTGPWNQPTIDDDAIRVSLDIGRAD